ncbi:MAG: amidohydrolase [Aureliella sp.]
MKRNINLAVAFLALATPLFGSDQIPGAKQTKAIALVGGTIHTVSGKPIVGGTVLFEDGKITAVGADVGIPDDAQVISVEDKHVYPSLIESMSDIGLVEINAVRASVDNTEIGSVNPNVRAVAAFNPDSEIIPVNRANGVLLAVTAPSGRFIAGRSSLMMMDGWTWEDMALKQDVGMHIRWPSNEDDIEELAQLLSQTRRYHAARKANPDAQPVDLKLEALGLLTTGKLPAVVYATSMNDITSAVAFAQREELRLIISGGYDAPEVAPLLKKAGIPVLVTAVYRTPSRRHREYDEGYTLPARLEEAGIAYCISAGGRFGASGVRNLPYNAATAAAYGLTPEQALRAITLSPAEILGVGDRVGSIDVGKDATLFVADGDILETPTHVEQAFIQGRKVDLDNKHKQLYRKYSAKYKRMK